MGLFDIFKRGGKLTPEKVDEMLIRSESESKKIDYELEERKRKIDEYMDKGRNETDRNKKLYYARAINALKAEQDQISKQAMLVLFQKQQLSRLRMALKNDEFYGDLSELGGALNNPAKLKKILDKSIQKRSKVENSLTTADETFKAYDDAFEENETIYGENEEDNALLAMFEKEDMVAAEKELFEAQEAAKKGESENE